MIHSGFKALEQPMATQNDNIPQNDNITQTNKSILKFFQIILNSNLMPLVDNFDLEKPRCQLNPLAAAILLRDIEILTKNKLSFSKHLNVTLIRVFIAQSLYSHLNLNDPLHFIKLVNELANLYNISLDLTTEAYEAEIKKLTKTFGEHSTAFFYPSTDNFLDASIHHLGIDDLLERILEFDSKIIQFHLTLNPGKKEHSLKKALILFIFYVINRNLDFVYTEWSDVDYKLDVDSGVYLDYLHYHYVEFVKKNIKA